MVQQMIQSQADVYARFLRTALAEFVKVNCVGVDVGVAKCFFIHCASKYGNSVRSVSCA